MGFNPMWGMEPGFMMFFLIAMLIPLAAQGYLMATYGRYKRVRANSGLTGHDIARRLLDRNGLYDVRVLEASGRLSDHYDPRSRTVSLSHDVYSQATIVATSIAAHEVGHAIQHAENYAPLKLRSAFVPVVNIANRFGFLIIIFGLIMEAFFLVEIGIILIASLVVFQLITLPVEFNASTRAMTQLNDMNILYDHSESRGARKVLTAAALTYVAALIIALMQLLRWVMILNRRRN